MQATTVFLARVKGSNGTFPFVPVEIKKGRPVQPDNASSYYARYSDVKANGTRGRIVKPLGNNFEEAYIAFLNLKAINEGRRAGKEIEAPIPSVGQSSLADAVAEYLDTCKSIGNAQDTLDAKTRTYQSFLQVAAQNGVTTIEGMKDPKIGKRALVAYINWMRDNMDTVGMDGTNPENTRNKRMVQLSAFLKQYGVRVKKAANAGPDDTGLLQHSEFPKYHQRKATMYSEATIKLWLEHATIDEADLIEMFLATGFRDEEVAHLEWADINFRERTVNVHAKAKTATRPWAWEPKDGESREEDIPLSDKFIERMEARRKRYAAQKCALIFPSGVCRPDDNLLRIARRAAQRAGITDRIAFHNIRKTVVSNLARKFGVEYAMQVAGHSDLTTTQGYLAKNTDSRTAHREALNGKSA